MSFGKNLKSVREFLGMSQAELAKRAKMTPPAVSQFESESREPNLKSLINLSKALGVSIDRLVFWK